MLIRFSVENFLSYKTTQIFSMVAGKHTKHNDHIIDINGKRFLKGSFFFGANASGKSNLFKAIDFSRSIVTNGIENTILSNKHFRIEREYVNRPGVFQFDIYTNNHYYSYGFAISYSKAIIIEEWLYLCDKGEKIIFERSIENEQLNIKTDYKFSDENNKQKFEIFSENVADNHLFLSEISKRKLIENEDFYAYKDVDMWFQELILIFPNSIYTNKLNLVKDDNNTLEHLMQDFDTGIENITVGKKKTEDALKFLSDDIRTDIIQELEKSFNQRDKVNGAPKAIDLSIEGKLLDLKKKTMKFMFQS